MSTTIMLFLPYIISTVAAVGTIAFAAWWWED